MDSALLINIILLVVLLFFALWTVITSKLLRAAIGLALTSAVLSIIMYRLGSPLAAVFELSVCTGLVSVIFFSAITLTERLTSERQMMREREIFLRRFWLLPIIVVVAVIIFLRVNIPVEILPAVSERASTDVIRGTIWDKRHLDIIGQIIILLTGAFGVILLFKGKKNE